MNSIVFFPLILVTCSAYTYFGQKYKINPKNLLIGIPLIILVFIFGVRINFGTDQPTYLHMYIYQKADLLRCEPIFVKVNQLLRNKNLPYQVLFITISFLEYYFIFKSFDKLEINVFWGLITFYIYYIFEYQNILRQCVAMSIVFYSYYYLYRKKYLEFILFVLLACGFHKSAILCLLFTPFILLSSKKIYSGTIYYVIAVMLLIFYGKFYDLSIFVLKKILGIFDVDWIANFMNFKIPSGSGLGVRLQIIAYICMFPSFIFYAKKDKKVNLFLNIFMIGFVGKYLSSLNMNLSRLFLYFMMAEIYLIPYCLCNIKKSDFVFLSLRTLLFIFGFLCFILLFIVNSINGINNCSFYQWNLNFNFKTTFY